MINSMALGAIRPTPFQGPMTLRTNYSGISLCLEMIVAMSRGRSRMAL
jgi:hypothetical protein